MVYVFLTTGFEPMETVSPVDMLRRAGVDVTTVSIVGGLEVQGAHGICIKADRMFADVDFSDAGMLILPGGPGSPKMIEHDGLCALLKSFAADGRPIAAICAAPSVLGRLGILDGRKATVYPGCGDGIENVDFTGRFVERDGNIITAIGPAASAAFAAEIIEFLCGASVRDSVCSAMQFGVR